VPPRSPMAAHSRTASFSLEEEEEERPAAAPPPLLTSEDAPPPPPPPTNAGVQRIQDAIMNGAAAAVANGAGGGPAGPAPTAAHPALPTATSVEEPGSPDGAAATAAAAAGGGLFDRAKAFARLKGLGGGGGGGGGGGEEALPPRPPPMLGRLRATATELSAELSARVADIDLDGLQTRARGLAATGRQRSQALLEAAGVGLRRLASPTPIEVLVSEEAAGSPCPQVLLMACAALAAGGTDAPGLFAGCGDGADAAGLRGEADALFGYLTARHLTLIPPATPPTVVAALAALLLRSLPEPLLTYRLCDEWLAAGAAEGGCSASAAGALLRKLPPANANAARLLLEAAFWVSREPRSGHTPRSLASELAPLLLWRPPPPPPPRPAAAAAAAATALSKLGAAWGRFGAQPEAAAAAPPPAPPAPAEPATPAEPVPLAGGDLAALVELLVVVIRAFRDVVS